MGNARCPLTCKQLEYPVVLIPNFALRKAIRAWTEERARRRQVDLTASTRTLPQRPLGS